MAISLHKIPVSFIVATSLFFSHGQAMIDQEFSGVEKNQYYIANLANEQGYNSILNDYKTYCDNLIANICKSKISYDLADRKLRELQQMHHKIIEDFSDLVNKNTKSLYIGNNVFIDMIIDFGRELDIITEKTSLLLTKNIIDDTGDCYFCYREPSCKQ